MTPEEFSVKVATFGGAAEWVANALISVRRVRPEIFEPDGAEKLDARQQGLKLLQMGDRSIIELASKSYWHHLMMRMGTAQAMRIGYELPDWATSWLVEELERDRPAVSRPRGRPTQFALHRLIAQLVETLVKADYAPYRNEDGKNPTSACDVVAAGLKMAKLQPASYASVKKIFERWENGTLIEDFGRLIKSRRFDLA